MQQIYPTSLTPEQYAEQEYHKQVKRPESCPNCQRAQTLLWRSDKLTRPCSGKLTHPVTA